MFLVTLDEAKQHLRMDHSDDDGLISLYIQAVSRLVLQFVKQTEADYPLDTAGDPVGVPFNYKAACLIWVGILYKNRDGGSDESLQYGDIPRTVSSLLTMDRLPTVA